MILQVDAVKALVSIPWETVTIPTVLVLIIAGLLWDRKRMLKAHKEKEDELSDRISDHMDDIKELSSMNSSVAGGFEKMNSSLMLILEMIKK